VCFVFSFPTSAQHTNSTVESGQTPNTLHKLHWHGWTRWNPLSVAQMQQKEGKGL